MNLTRTLCTCAAAGSAVLPLQTLSMFSEQRPRTKFVLVRGVGPEGQECVPGGGGRGRGGLRRSTAGRHGFRFINMNERQSKLERKKKCLERYKMKFEQILSSPVYLSRY